MNNMDILSILQRDKLHRLSESSSRPTTTAQNPVAPPVWVGQHPQKPLKPLI